MEGRELTDAQWERARCAIARMAGKRWWWVSREDRLSAASEAMVVALGRWRPDGGSALMPWVIWRGMGQMRRVLANDLRAAGVAKECCFPAGWMELRPAPPVDGKGVDELMGLCGGLTRAERRAVRLRFEQGCSFRAMGIWMGIPTETARRRLRCALAKMAGELRRRGIGERDE